jgi:hypothetical protein
MLRWRRRLCALERERIAGEKLMRTAIARQIDINEANPDLQHDRWPRRGRAGT